MPLDLIKTIRDAAYEVRKVFSAGYLEAVYKNALIYELQTQGLKVEWEYPIEIYYKNKRVGFYKADIIVEGKVIIEVKAVRMLTNIHSMQLVNYLTATGIDDGILVNYGASDYRCMHKTRIYNPYK